jgi:serine/threonine-protein kinase
MGSSGNGPPGFSVGGRYSLGPQIGRGGMGAVYRAVDARTERTVALKLLLDADQKALGRFRREARAAASLRHPHIVGVLDFDIDDPNGPYIVMELVDGVSLHALLEREGRLEPSRAVAMATQLFSALAHAHAAGILHRDVKPGNILVSTAPGAPDFLRLVDFGLAKHTDPAQGGPAITTMASMLGTPAFMPPEQMTGDVLDARADIYSAGLVLYAMLSGVDPYPLTGTERMLAVIARKPGRPLLATAPWVEPALAALVDQCIAPERSQRPGSAAEVIDRLSRLSTSSAPRLVPAPSMTSAQIASGVPTVGAPNASNAPPPMSAHPALMAPSLAYGAATQRPASHNYAPTVGGPAPLQLTVHDSRTSMPPHSMMPPSVSAYPPPGAPPGPAAATTAGAPRNALVIVLATLGAVFVVGALALGGFYLFGHRGDSLPGGVQPVGSASASASASAAASSGAIAASSAAATPSAAATSTSAHVAPRPGGSTAPKAGALASVPPATTAAAPAPSASATAPSCFCNTTRFGAVCTTPQESACSCGGQLCATPITDNGVCPVRNFSGKRTGDPCIGFTPGPAVNGKVTSVMQQATLICNMCPKATRVPATPGAPCSGISPSGATESGTFVCNR